MNEEKQIEEMAKHIPARMFTRNLSANCAEVDEYHRKLIAEHLLRAGYRKASDVVEEVIVQIENTLNKIIEQCESTGRVEGCAIAKVMQLRLSTELKKKYTESEKDNV